MTRALLAPLLLLLAAGAARAAPQASISGKVLTLDHGKPVTADDVYVYLEPIVRHRTPPAPRTETIVQKNRQFTPHVLVVPVGSTVWFPNEDSEEHNVFTPDGPPHYKDLGRYNTDKKGRSMNLPDPGEVDFFCDVHQWMWAKVKVVESDQILPVVNGSFRFDGLAPGKYKVWAWAPNSSDVSSGELVVEAGTALVLPDALHVQLDTTKKKHDRKDGAKYRCPQYCGSGP